MRPMLPYSYSVGFGIAYPWRKGIAKAYKSGVSKRFDSHAFSFVFAAI